MKKLPYARTIVCAVILFLSVPVPAQDKPAPRYEYAIVKWDGPDRLYYNLPEKFELVHLLKIGVTIPKDAESEEFCLAYAANKMAKEGWESVTLNSRRILFRRPIK